MTRRPDCFAGAEASGRVSRQHLFAEALDALDRLVDARAVEA